MKDHEQRLKEYQEYKQNSSEHSWDEYLDIINSDEVLLDALDGMQYDFIATCEEDVWKFIERFQDPTHFIGYLIEEVSEYSEEFIKRGLNSDCYDMITPPRKYVTVNTNGFKDFPVEKVFYPDQVIEQYTRKNFVLSSDWKDAFPCVVSWIGQDSFDFGGSLTKRLVTVVKLNRTHFIQSSLL